MNSPSSSVAVVVTTCSGITARHCPVHGDCSCPEDGDLDALGCPLHDPASEHPVRSSGYLRDLINRLRGVYVTPVNDGAGLLHGKDTYTATFDVPPIHREAALAIEELEDRLEVLDASE